MVSVELWWIHDGEHDQGHNSGRVTHGVEVAAAFAVVQVKVIGVALLLRCESLAYARAPYVFGDLPF